MKAENSYLPTTFLSRLHILAQKRRLPNFYREPPVIQWEGAKPQIVLPRGIDTARSDGTLTYVTSLFTKTSKMNCYSFNLAAGPPELYGTCPGSRFGFDASKIASDPKLKRLANKIGPISALDGVVASEQHSAEDMQTTIPTTEQDAKRRFLCSGCYALKANYIYSSMALSQMVKKLFVDYLLDTGQFVDTFAELIWETSRRLAKKPMPTELVRRAQWTDPQFFRIHDSGDFFSPEYLEAWIKVCEKLPEIFFWAPTRAWADEGMLEAIRAAVIPKNLALRPSGLFFDGPQPRIQGLAGGTSSTLFLYEQLPGKVHVRLARAGDSAWGCPAYLPTVMGGGAIARSIPAVHERAAAKRPVRVAANPLPSKQLVPAQTTRDLVVWNHPNETPVWYDAVINTAGEYVIDPEKGTPLSVAKASDYLFDDNWNLVRKRNKTRGAEYEPAPKIPRKQIRAAQAFQPSGCCALAKDPYGNQGCRICWGVTQDPHRGPVRTEELHRLPIVYAKH